MMPLRLNMTEEEYDEAMFQEGIDAYDRIRKGEQ